VRWLLFNKVAFKTSPINFAWIELLPMMIVLVVVAFFIGFFPTLDYIPFAIERIDIENVLNNVTLGEP